MNKKKGRSVAGRYLTALAAPAAVAVAMQLSWPFFEQSPGALFLLAIMFCSWYGGLGPGLLSVLVSLLLADFLFIAPYFALWPLRHGDLVYLVTIAVVGPVLSMLSELMHRARRRAEISLEELTQQTARSRTDLVERERAEEALRRSREQMAGVIGSAMDGIITVDSDQRILLFNLAAEKMFRCTSAEAIGQGLDRFMPKRFRPTHSEHIRSFGHTGVATRAMAGTRTIYGLRTNGEEFPLEASISQVESGEQKLYTVIMRDITERKQAEEAQRASEGRYSALFECAPDGIVIADPESYYIDANASMCRMLGYTRDEMIGKHASDIVVETEIQHIGPALSAIKAGPDYHREWQFRRKDGSSFAAEVIAATMPDGNLLGMIRDITERKRIEKALTRTQDQMAGVIGSAMDAIITVDSEQRILLFNTAAEKMFRCSGDEAIGQALDRFMPERFRHAHSGHVQSFGHTGVTTRAMAGARTIYGLRADGEEFPLEASISQLESGAEKLYTVILRDITERKRAEDALLASEARFSVAFNATPVSSVIATLKEGRYVAVNDTFLSLTGYKREELIGNTSADLTIWPNPEARAEVVQLLLAQGQIRNRETEYRMKNGEARIFLTSADIIELEDQPHLITASIDITDRKRVEEALRGTQARMAGVIGSAMDAIITADSEQRILLFNTAAEKMFRCSSDEAIGQALDRFIPERFRHSHSGHVRSFGHTGVTTRAVAGARTIYGLRADGEEFPLEASISQVESDGNKLYTVILRDITERKRVEAALLTSEAQLQTIVEGLDDGLAVSDLEGQLLHFNRAARDMHGFASIEECRRHLTEFTDIFEIAGTDGAVWPVEQWPLARILRGEKLRDVKACIRRIHSEWHRVFNYGGTIVHDAGGQPLMAVVTISDITERDRAQAALLRLSAIVESSSDAIISTNLDGTILTWNPGAEKLFGYSATEAIGRHMTIVVPGDRADEVHHLLERIGRGESANNYETTRLNRDGRRIDVSITISPIRDAEGKIIGASTSARDIAEQKQAARRLAALAVDLERRNRELQDFASVASHDLQEPLRKIQTFADDLVTNSAGLDDDRRDTLQRIQRAAGRMQGLINDLLALSRVTSKTRSPSPVDFNDLVREVLIDLEIRIKETGGRVEVGEIPNIEAEPSQMRQLLQNLISNALKFHSPGRAPIVKINGELLNGNHLPAGNGDAPATPLCRITVEDNGIGFDEKYVDRIFAMFQRLHGRSAYEGTGIGLAICRRIAEHHGGQITARSIPGQGSTFIVTMPIKQHQGEDTNGQ